MLELKIIKNELNESNVSCWINGENICQDFAFDSDFSTDSIDSYIRQNLTERGYSF